MIGEEMILAGEAPHRNHQEVSPRADRRARSTDLFFRAAEGDKLKPTNQ